QPLYKQLQKRQRQKQHFCAPPGFQDLPIVSRVVAVILESRSPGSVVTQKEENNGFWTETFQNDFVK
ncbi:hypothetical protein, partial [Candidatus Avelusimicrobium stercoris]|uniref:hypothetical protein n=1 Tax=Candidatus Avelusimicrobium stercoris TaxID=1947924 RepID=UPI003D0F52B8